MAAARFDEDATLSDDQAVSSGTAMHWALGPMKGAHPHTRRIYLTIFIFLYVAPGNVENIDPPSLEGPGWLRGDPPWWVSGTEGGARMVLEGCGCGGKAGRR